MSSFQVKHDPEWVAVLEATLGKRRVDRWRRDLRAGRWTITREGVPRQLRPTERPVWWVYEIGRRLKRLGGPR